MSCEYQIVPARHSHGYLSVDAVATCCGVHPDRIHCYIEYGLIEPAESEPEFLFDASAVPRVRKIERLRADLGINLPGIAVILQLLELIRELRTET